MEIDEIDRRILRRLQRQSDISLEVLGDQVGLSRNAVWRRIRLLEENGYIDRRVAILDPVSLDLGLSVFIQIRTNRHDPDWLQKFSRTMREMPEILGAYRMTGDLDYLIRARVSDVAAYDRLYQRLIKSVEISDVAASFVMEDLKETTELPI